MVVNNIVKHLLRLGLSDYESRAYLAALSLPPATAYEIAKESGIPSSKIYEVISRLAERGMMHETIESGKKKYVPEKWQEFLAREEYGFKNSLQILRQNFPLASEARGVSFIYNIHDYEHLLEKSIRCIQEAKKTVLLSVWPEELEYFRPALEKARENGINIAIVHFGPPEVSVGTMFVHPIQDTLFTEKGGRGLALVTDSSTALTGTVFTPAKAQGAWSASSGFVLITEDYIKHDIYIMKIVSRFDRLLLKTFGPNYSRLRNIFSDDEVTARRRKNDLHRRKNLQQK